MMEGPKINVTRTIIHKATVPYNEEWYPGMTFDEAVEYEKNMDAEEALELLEMATVDELEVKSEVTVSGNFVSGPQ